MTRYADRATTLSPEALSPDASAELISSALSGTTANDDAELKAWIIASAAGNPLFLASLVAQYLSTGTRFAVPPTLNTLLSSRLHAIGGRSLSVLRMCHVLGKYCTVWRLVAALEVPQIDLLESLSELETARLIRTDADWITIAHGLLADAVTEHSPAIALQVA